MGVTFTCACNAHRFSQAPGCHPPRISWTRCPEPVLLRSCDETDERQESEPRLPSSAWGSAEALQKLRQGFRGATEDLCLHISAAGLPTLSAPVEPRASEAAKGWKRCRCSCRRLQPIPPCHEMLRLSDHASEIEPAGQTCCLVFVPTANGRKRHVPRQHRVILLPEHCLAW